MASRYMTATFYDNDFSTSLAEAIHFLGTTCRSELDSEEYKQLLVKTVTFVSRLKAEAASEIDVDALMHTHGYLTRNIEVKFSDERPTVVNENFEFVIFDSQTKEIWFA